MTIPDRRSFAQRLGDALSATEPGPEVRDLLREVLTEDPSDWESHSQQVVRRVAERLDTTVDDETRMVALARDLQTLLEDASSSEAVEALLELIAERRRFLQVLQKYDKGVVSRTSLLSYISEQRWPRSQRQRLAELTGDNRSDLMAALQCPNVVWLDEALT